ncbi:cytochrome C [Pseudoroseomonas wenyumeiae]|uniref:Cytochrome C n=1 Tax=Teichococcus wenyumeiae TaxID=2478470 RepID=A0A3A9JCX3_9PROT|nr:NAD(P)/FAD-dependent oxidoreductase [Pseudoroseomonas wenyumeiae]RKK05177.1 cytochrome C [Pseudoroseomonas wenyumeiae]RMI17562.1 cytochrome C [Pseudoroseomonas wenyumeiae]
MTIPLTRRTLLGATLAAPSLVHAQAAARLLVVGGGFGGATAASFARREYPWLDVTLVEQRQSYVTCPYSNRVLAGDLALPDITHGYEGLRAMGVRVIHDRAVHLDPVARRLRLGGGETLSYDRMILSPGIALRYEALEGYDEAASTRMPHAWIAADGAQITLLRRQLEAMPDGGVVGLVIPPNPYRCPPGPYERISLIASYLSKHKPRSKILALDAKDTFSKQALFQDAWQALYPGMIEWVSATNDGRVVRVDPEAMVLETEFGTHHRVDVANVIPPQTAAAIATEGELADSTGWVPVNPRTLESRIAPGIHVVGDAMFPGPMPKSGFLANSEAKAAVSAAAALLRGAAPPEPVFVNTCYSHIGPDYAISVANIFHADTGAGSFLEVPGSGGTSPRGGLPEQRRLEALHADGWYASITRDMFGS